jgi:hypothetical protein
MASPLNFVWTGVGFTPETPRILREACSRYGVGEVVPLDVAHQRSKASHDHFFAVVAEAHGTLPEQLGERFPTPDSLRHYALCKAGFCDVETFSASSRAEALRLAGFIRAGVRDGVQVVVSGATVTRLTPHSQSLKAMGKAVFQDSKTRCLELIAGLLETTPEALGRAA